MGFSKKWLICSALVSLALISALVSAFLIPWIKTKIDADKLQTLRTYVEIGVKAAEQLYTATPARRSTTRWQSWWGFMWRS